MIRMKLITHPDDQDIQFQCLEPGCGDIVGSHRLNVHARRAHHSNEVAVETSQVRRMVRKNPMCDFCGHSMWYHDQTNHCSRCNLHD